jgi:hypothetical protein
MHDQSMLRSSGMCSEYVGEELFAREDGVALSFTRDFTKRNYGFNGRRSEFAVWDVDPAIHPKAKMDYNTVTIIDSSALGNISRYLNHSTRQPNCVPSALPLQLNCLCVYRDLSEGHLVDEDHRIGIYTSKSEHDVGLPRNDSRY